MRTPIDQQFLDEARRYAFRFACEDCAHFDRGAERCSLGYPAAPRRDHVNRSILELCKSFECA